MKTIQHDHLIAACVQFNAHPDELHPLSGGTYTAVYGCRIGEQECVMRFLPVEQESSLAATLDWLSFLAERGAPVAHPVLSLANRLIEHLGGEGSEFLVHVVKKAPGTLAEALDPAAWSADLFTAIGQATGHFHTLTGQYHPSDTHQRRPDWYSENTEFISGNYHNALPPDLQALNERLTAQMLALPRGDQDYGLVHGDLHFANFFVDDQRVTIFDFDDSCYGWYALDVAMILFDVLVLYPGADQADFAERFLRAFLRGYRSQRPFELFWLKQLPLLLKIQELWIYTLLLPEDQEWEPGSWPAKFMFERRARLQAGLAYVELDFANLQAAAQAWGKKS